MYRRIPIPPKNREKTKIRMFSKDYQYSKNNFFPVIVFEEFPYDGEKATQNVLVREHEITRNERTRETR